MNKFDRFRFGNLHKRRIFSMFIILAVVFVITVCVLLFLGVFGSRSELVRIRITSEVTGGRSSGIGINLDDMPSVNRISDPQVASRTVCTDFMIEEVSDNVVYLDKDNGIVTADDLSDGISGDLLMGGTVRILSVDSEGAMTQRFTGTVSDYGSLGLGPMKLIEDNEGSWFSDDIVKMVSNDTSFAAVTRSGKVILDITGKHPSVKEDAVFVDILVYDGMFYALSETGEIYYSSDGRFFGLYMEALTDDEKEGMDGDNGLRALSFGITSSVADVLLSDGSVRTVTYNSISENPVGKLSGSPLLISATGRAVIATSDGRILETSNGIVFAQAEDGLPPLDDGVFPVDCCSGKDKAAILYSDGSIIVLDTLSGAKELITELRYTPYGYTKIGLSDDGDICVLSDDGVLSYFDGRRMISRLYSDKKIDEILYVGEGGKLIVGCDDGIYSTGIYTMITLDSSIPSDSVSRGDIMTVEGITDEFDRDMWYVTDQDTYVDLVSPDEGNGNMIAISSGSTGTHTASMRLPGSASDNFSENTFYRLSCQIKQDGNLDGTVKIWISGDSNRFGKEGSTFDDISAKSRECSFVFAPTHGKVSSKENIWINFSFEGSGTLYVDDMFLGEDKYEMDTVPMVFSEKITEASPSAVRLNNLDFCYSGFSEEIFYGTGADSLEAGLRLVQQAGADPWITIGPYADQKTIDGLISYLCGPVSSYYGRIRSDNGSAFPWERQFDVFYIEINDPDDTFSGDAQKGAYVTYVMDLFTQSEYYQDIRDNIIFLDGMEYEGSIARSEADYHTTGITIDMPSANDAFSDKVGRSYSDLSADTPRFSGRASGGEFVSSLSITPGNGTLDPNAGRWVAFLLNRNASFIGMTLIDVDVSKRPVDSESEYIFCYSDDIKSDKQRRSESDEVIVMLDTMAQLDIIGGATGLEYYVSDPMDISSTQKAEDFEEACTTALIENDGIIYLIVANPSSSQQQFVAEGMNVKIDNAEVRRFSSEGKLIVTRNGLNRDRRQILQPGEYMIIAIPTENAKE